jgi:hypothetical protein
MTLTRLTYVPEVSDSNIAFVTDYHEVVLVSDDEPRASRFK